MFFLHSWKLKDPMDWRSQHPALPRYEWGNHFTSWLHTVDDMILTKYVIYIYISTYIHIYIYIICRMRHARICLNRDFLTSFELHMVLARLCSLPGMIHPSWRFPWCWKTMQCLPSLMTYHKCMGGKNKPFPVMGGLWHCFAPMNVCCCAPSEIKMRWGKLKNHCLQYGRWPLSACAVWWFWKVDRWSSTNVVLEAGN